jgi:TM2 domain-containing membrane protein YozV
MTMAVFAIPNPKKNLTVDFSLEKVKDSVKNISLINPQYKFSSSNEIFNHYTYESYEFLSLGVFIDINLNSISEMKTEITIEIRRKLGTFNESHEVTYANNHIVKIVNHIAQLIAMSAEDIIKLKLQHVKKSQTVRANQKQVNKDKNTAAILAFLLGGLGIHRFYLNQPWLGILYLIFCWTFIPLCLALIDFFALIFMSNNKFNLKYNK